MAKWACLVFGLSLVEFAFVDAGLDDGTSPAGVPLYGAEEFNKSVPTKEHFVMFFAPWCGHCQRLEPTWEQLGELLNVEDSRVRIARVDCTVEKELCSQQDITGYPTLKFFKVGNTEGVKFRGIRDLSTLSTFINEQLGDTGTSEDEEITPVEQVPCVELTEDTFFPHIANGYHFVKFYAPWCGHCQKLAPTWEKLAETYAGKKTISISKIDCTQYRSVCTQFEIKGYPTLLWIENGKKVEKYSGARSHEDFKSYIDNKVSSDAGKDKKAQAAAGEGQAVLILTTDNFDQTVKSGYVFVKFFAPWCGHCIRLSPTWDELGRKFISHDRVKIGKVDCSVESNKNLCTKQNIAGFPSLYLFKDGKRLIEYEGSRSLEDLYDYISAQMEGVHDEL